MGFKRPVTKLILEIFEVSGGKPPFPTCKFPRLESCDHGFINHYFLHRRGKTRMTWIKTVSASEDEKVRKAAEGQRHLYPIEYATPVHPTPDGESSGIVESHSLIPDALYHAFATYGSLLSPDLPLQRHQHEMIATMVSVTNRCHY